MFVAPGPVLIHSGLLASQNPSDHLLVRNSNAKLPELISVRLGRPQEAAQVHSNAPDVTKLNHSFLTSFANQIPSSAWCRKTETCRYKICVIRVIFYILHINDVMPVLDL